MMHRRSKPDSPQVIHHGFLLEVEGSRGLQAFDEKPKEENMSQECPECGKLMAGEKCDSCGYSPKKLHDDDDDDLIDVEADPRQEMLKYLREIRPEVEAKGSDGMKRRWNDAWRSVKTGRHPRESLDRLRRQYDSLRTADTSDRMHRRQGADENGHVMSGRDLAEIAAPYLGRDISEVTEEQRRAPRRAADESSRPMSAGESLMRKAEEARQRMCRQYY
jgi:hypothetical protein